MYRYRRRYLGILWDASGRPFQSNRRRCGKPWTPSRRRCLGEALHMRPRSVSCYSSGHDSGKPPPCGMGEMDTDGASPPSDAVRRISRCGTCRPITAKAKPVGSARTHWIPLTPLAASLARTPVGQSVTGDKPQVFSKAGYSARTYSQKRHPVSETTSGGHDHPRGTWTSYREQQAAVSGVVGTTAVTLGRHWTSRCGAEEGHT